MTAKRLNRRYFIGLLAALPGGAALLSACGNNELNGLQSAVQPSLSPAENGQSQAIKAAALPSKGAAPEFDNTSWINSSPLRLADLRGKVVALEFWTFGCINCQHVIPSLRDWYSEFNNQGLVIIGMHSPEFDYEKKLENVKQAVQQNAIKYPVAQDNDFATWNKYKVQAWPTLLLIDKAGQIRYRHIGEGAYEDTRAAIQALLAE
ncbi:MAG TPA: redoxin domain-containing protein [Chloroflexia bacterium]|nr:redoxin domain-containing protein [Chloroflexia bacterium]